MSQVHDWNKLNIRYVFWRKEGGGKQASGKYFKSDTWKTPEIDKLESKWDRTRNQLTGEMELIRQDMNSMEERRKEDSTSLGKLDKKVGKLQEYIQYNKNSHVDIIARLEKMDNKFNKISERLTKVENSNYNQNQNINNLEICYQILELPTKKKLENNIFRKKDKWADNQGSYKDMKRRERIDSENGRSYIAELWSQSGHKIRT